MQCGSQPLQTESKKYILQGQKDEQKRFGSIHKRLIRSDYLLRRNSRKRQPYPARCFLFFSYFSLSFTLFFPTFA